MLTAAMTAPSRNPSEPAAARGARQVAMGLAMALILIHGRPGTSWAQDEPPAQVNKVGEYSGVSPRNNPLKPPRRPNVLSWIGFQPQDGGQARLFIQLSSEVSYTQAVKDGTLYLMLEGVSYRNANARRRLDTRFFDTALQQVTSRRVSKRRARRGQPAQPGGIELRIQFKNAADARPGNASMSAGEDGYYYLFLELPPASGQGSARLSDPE